MTTSRASPSTRPPARAAWPVGPERIGPILAELARAAEAAGFATIAVMDHVWQHPYAGGPERSRRGNRAGDRGWTHVRSAGGSAMVNILSRARLAHAHRAQRLPGCH